MSLEYWLDQDRKPRQGSSATSRPTCASWLSGTAPAERNALPLESVARPSLHWLSGINFELTYDCNLRCAHCLQADLRTPGWRGWADPLPIRQAIEDAVALNFVDQGINFTGGEILRPGSPLPQLLAVTRALGLPVRVNTNGWWGAARRIGIGDLCLPDVDGVVDWLRSSGVRALALSYDRRDVQYPHLWRGLRSIIAACERRGLDYDLNFTGIATQEIARVVRDLQTRLDRPLDHCRIIDLDLVDLGGAVGRLPETPLGSTSLTERLRRTDCQLRGFYRPYYLHVAPDGGVRSCMMAAGAGWLGNIRHAPLPVLAERFAANPVVRWFASSPTLSSERLPSGSRWHEAPRHPCALAVTLARDIERGWLVAAPDRVEQVQDNG